jgi:hypothetical protein
MSRDITSANSSAVAHCKFFPAGLKFEQYSADGAWTQDAYQTVETRMGVDGKMSAGYTPMEKEITFSFQANSPTLDGLDIIWQTTEVSKTPEFLQIIIECPSIKKRFVLANCVLMNYKLIPNAQKVLEPVDATFRCESISSDPMA